MNKQISLTIPEPMLRKAQQKAKEEGFRNVQEYCLQALRDKWFMERLPYYEKLSKELDEGKGYEMDLEEWEQYRKLYGKERTKFLKAHKIRK